MLPSEILERSRSAAKRLMRIDAEIRELHDKIGVQGHSYGFHGKNDIRDPMRKVDEMLDGTEDLETERAMCRMDISEAWRVIDGVRALDAESSERFTCGSEYVLTEYYVYARSESDIARRIGYSEGICSKLIGETVRRCDEIGYAGLVAAGSRGAHVAAR